MGRVLGRLSTTEHIKQVKELTKVMGIIADLNKKKLDYQCQAIELQTATTTKLLLSQHTNLLLQKSFLTFAGGADIFRNFLQLEAQVPLDSANVDAATEEIKKINGS